MKNDIIKGRYLSDVRVKEELQSFAKAEKDPIINSIFAVDPLTGKPSSDLSMVYSSNTPEDVKQYIRSQLAVSQKQISVAPDAETSEISVKRAFETREEYFDRIREFVKSNSKAD